MTLSHDGTNGTVSTNKNMLLRAGALTQIYLNEAGHRVTLGGSTNSGFNNLGGSSHGTFLTIDGSHDGADDETAVISLENSTTTDDRTLGLIQFVNKDNSSASNNDATGRQLAAIQATASDIGSVNNAQDNSGGSLIFKTKKFNEQNKERLRITHAGTVNIGTNNLTQTTYKAQIETGTNKFISFDSGGHSDFSNEGASILFSRPSDGAKELSGLMSITNGGLLLGARGEIVFATGGGSTFQNTDERARITADGIFQIGTTKLGPQVLEKANLVSNKISAASDLDIDDGNVFHYTFGETANGTPNITSSTSSVNSIMAVGDSLTVTLISVVGTGGYYQNVTIDGSAPGTIKWLNDAEPSSASSNGDYDVYTYTIIKTGSTPTYLVLANRSVFK